MILDRCRQWLDTRSMIREISKTRQIEQTKLAGSTASPLQKAIDALAAGDVEKAYGYWVRACEELPDQVLQSKSTIDILLQSGHVDELEALLLTGHRKSRRDRLFLNGLARLAEARGNTEEASQWWAKLRTIAPKDVDGWLAGAACLERLDRNRQRLAVLRSGYSFCVNEIQYWISLARAQEAVGKWPQAVKSWDYLTGLHNHSVGYVRGAEACKNISDVEGALERLKMGQEKYPYDPDILTSLASLEEQVGNLLEAAQAWADLRMVRPQLEIGYREGIRCLDLAGQNDIASELRADATKRFPEASFEPSKSGDVRLDSPESKPEISSPISQPEIGMKTSLIADINFGRNGNASFYQRNGWSLPEDDYTFAIGELALASIPGAECEHGLILELRLHPFICGDVLQAQRIYLRVNCWSIGNAEIKRMGTVAFFIPSHVAAKTLELEIAQPDATKPAEISESQDNRCLGVALRNIQVHRLEAPLNRRKFTTIRTILGRDLGLRGAMDEVEANLGLPADRLVMEFESLGDDSDFGMLQRLCGAEPLGLLRFSAVPLPALLRGLDNAFEGLGSPETIVPRLEDTPKEWMVFELQYQLRYHSFKGEHEATEEQIRQREVKKLTFLHRKMIEDLTNPTKIFVYKRHPALSLEEVLPVFRAMNKYAPNSLLWVVPAAGKYMPGTCEELLPGLYRGHIDSLKSNVSPGQQSTVGWLEICAATYLLRKGQDFFARQQYLASEVWHSAGNGRLSKILTGGWSLSEGWGIWGIGACHQIRLTTDLPQPVNVAVDLDVHAFVWDETEGRHIDVFVNGWSFSELVFTMEKKSASLSLEPLTIDDAYGPLTIEFRHRTLARPREIDPSIEDARQLGLALHRIRIRALVAQ